MTAQIILFPNLPRKPNVTANGQKLDKLVAALVARTGGAHADEIRRLCIEMKAKSDATFRAGRDG